MLKLAGRPWQWRYSGRASGSTRFRRVRGWRAHSVIGWSRRNWHRRKNHTNLHTNEIRHPWPFRSWIPALSKYHLEAWHSACARRAGSCICDIWIPRIISGSQLLRFFRVQPCSCINHGWILPSIRPPRATLTLWWEEQITFTTCRDQYSFAKCLINILIFKNHNI